MQVVFETKLGEERVFGRGRGKKVNFAYSAFQPFVGLISYEHNEETLGIGTYEDRCHMMQKNLPFDDTKLPSMSEV